MFGDFFVVNVCETGTGVLVVAGNWTVVGARTGDRIRSKIVTKIIFDVNGIMKII
jgi:hypothetical protein